MTVEAVDQHMPAHVTVLVWLVPDRALRPPSLQFLRGRALNSFAKIIPKLLDFFGCEDVAQLHPNRGVIVHPGLPGPLLHHVREAETRGENDIAQLAAESAAELPLWPGQESSCTSSTWQARFLCRAAVEAEAEAREWRGRISKTK